jgi:hypothetical protein
MRRSAGTNTSSNTGNSSNSTTTTISSRSTTSTYRRSRSYDADGVLHPYDPPAPTSPPLFYHNLLAAPLSTCSSALVLSSPSARLQPLASSGLQRFLSLPCCCFCFCTVVASPRRQRRASTVQQQQRTRRRRRRRPVEAQQHPAACVAHGRRGTTCVCACRLFVDNFCVHQVLPPTTHPPEPPGPSLHCLLVLLVPCFGAMAMAMTIL